jgi:hypothetical protein
MKQNSEMKIIKKREKSHKYKMSNKEAVKYFSGNPILKADLLVGQMKLYFPPTHLTFRQKGVE